MLYSRQCDQIESSWQQFCLQKKPQNTGDFLDYFENYLFM